jgi:rhodanese-related sulfurtransferase
MLSVLQKDDEIVVYCTNPPCLASVAAYRRAARYSSDKTRSSG